MNRHLCIGAIFMTCAAALGLGSRALDRRATSAPRRRRCRRRAFEVRSTVAQASPEQVDSRSDDRRLGRRAGSRLDHPSRRLARAGRGARDDESADGAVLRAGAADSRVRRRRQSRSATGAVRVRATTGPTRITASRSTTAATCGSAATAAARRRRQDAVRRGRGQPAAGQNRQQDESQTGGTQSFNDNMVLKFTQDGKFLMQIGKPRPSKGSNDIANLRLPAKTFIDKETNELYVADGYGNHRVIVFDAETGKYKRALGRATATSRTMWISDGYDPKAPPAQQFRNPVHCADLSVDRLLYVCDRVNDRHAGVQAGRHVRRRKRSSTRRRWVPVRRGTSRSRRIRSRAYCTWPTARTTRCSSILRDTLEAPHEFRRGRAAARRVLRRAQPRDRSRRGTSTRPRHTAVSACRSSPTRARAGDEEGSGRRPGPRGRSHSEQGRELRATIRACPFGEAAVTADAAWRTSPIPRSSIRGGTRALVSAQPPGPMTVGQHHRGPRQWPSRHTRRHGG